MATSASSEQSVEPCPLAVLISGAGSNLLAIEDACRRGDIPARIALVLSDKPQAAGLARAAERGLDTLALPIEAGESRSDHDARLLRAIEASGARVVILAGYMRILSAAFVEALEGRLLNIHPSLLPRHKGLHTHRRVLEAGETEHGATVHFVTVDLDGGPPVLQAVIPVRPSDTEQTLAMRVQRCEHAIYPTVVGWLASGRLRCRQGQVILDGNRLPGARVEHFEV